jgi:rhamnose utilization protein RhaD (predicted bifunctional aldolase and dehydrogenase)
VPQELDELIRISRFVGADPDWVQGGGGNTSVKSADGATMFVKASGTSLAGMDATRGWAELDLPATRAVVDTPGLAELPVREREERVLNLLRAAARRPAGVRPSVEASLHALLDRVVIHTHPIHMTAFLASRDSREQWRNVLEGFDEPTLYVPYVDPGYSLAAVMAREIAKFEQENGRRPRIVLLENHGLFVAAETGDAAFDLHVRATAAGVKWSGRERVNPKPDEAREVASASASEPASAGDAAARLVLRVRGALLRGGAQPLLVRLDRSSIAADLVKDGQALEAAAQGAFTPDLICYCRTYPVVFRGSDRNVWAGAVAGYREVNGVDPRVVLVPGRGVVHVAPDVAQLKVVSETHRLGQAALLCSARAGGPRFLDRRQAGFIEEWEVEKFRADLVAGQARPLAGRVVVVLGGGGGEGDGARTIPSLTSALEAAGAVVATSSAEHLSAAVSECGGLDVVIDAAAELTPTSSLLIDLMALFAMQDAGGTIVAVGRRDEELVALAGPGRLAGVSVRGLPAGEEPGAAILELLAAPQ